MRVIVVLLALASMFGCSSSDEAGATGDAGDTNSGDTNRPLNCDPSIDVRDAHPDPGWTCCPLPSRSCSHDPQGGSVHDDQDAEAACAHVSDYGGKYTYCIDEHGCPVAFSVPCGPGNAWKCASFGECGPFPAADSADGGD